MFADFINKVCDNDEKRVNRLKSAMGYLLNRNKDRQYSKFVLFANEDENLLCLGKSLITKAISSCVDTNFVDASVKDVGKYSLFSDIQFPPSVVCFDNIQEGFDFEKYFKCLNSSIRIERMNRNPFVIDFENSPKLAGKTSCKVKLEDLSLLRRFEVVGIGNYFNKDNTVYDEYKTVFFADWVPDEWDMFFMFMNECVNLFNKHGRILEV